MSQVLAMMNRFDPLLTLPGPRRLFDLAWPPFKMSARETSIRARPVPAPHQVGSTRFFCQDRPQ